MKNRLNSKGVTNGAGKATCAKCKGTGKMENTKDDICENGKEHEWEETGGHIEHSANHLSVLYFTHYKCKHCPATKSVLDEVHDH